MNKNKTTNLEDAMFQNIIISFENGEKITASVPAFCEDEKVLEKLHITKIEISRPQILPKDSSFKLIQPS